MKVSHFFFYLFAGVVGVIFGGFFLGLILDRFFSGELETGDMATWAAAFGTICTLGFLINQHTQLREEQHREKLERKVVEKRHQKELCEEREKRETHERKQQAMWAEQNQMLHFQKYQEHKKAFFSHLSYIEEITKGQVEFQYRASLYESLFPDNNFEYCECHIDDVDASAYLRNVLQLTKLVDEALYSTSVRPRSLFEDIHTLCLELRINVRVLDKGSIEIGEGVQVDFFEPNKSIHLIKHVILELIRFTKASIPMSLRKREKSIRKEWLKVQLELLEPVTTATMVVHSLNNIDNSDCKLFILFLASHYLNEIPNLTLKQKDLSIALFSISYCRDKYKHLVLNDHSFSDLLGRIWNEFDALSNDTNDSELKQNYFVLSKAARFCMVGKMVPWHELPKNQEESAKYVARHGWL